MKIGGGGIVNKWVKIYGGRRNAPVDFAGSVAFDEEGNIIVAGSTGSFGAGGLDFWVLKLDKDGDIVWQKAYGGEEDEDARKVAVDDEGNIVIVGLERFPFSKKSDVWVLKLDKDGDIVWQKACRGKGNNEANCLAIDGEGNIVVAGSTETFGAGKRDVWVLKLDKDGDIVWQKAYGGKNNDEAHSVAIDEDRNIIVAGSTGSFGAGGLDFWVLKLDENGNIVWQKAYGGKKNDEAHSVAIDEDRNIVVAGSTETFGAGKSDVWVLKLNEYGDALWQRTYGGEGDDFAEDVTVDDDGNIVVVGSTETFSAGDYPAAMVLCLGPDGEVYSSLKRFTVTSTNTFPIVTKAYSSFTPAKVSYARLELLNTWKTTTDTKATVTVLAPPQ
ncbi:MAG: hypothetical protein QXN15_10930 [Candidatus Jordarchaeales archaeon]